MISYKKEKKPLDYSKMTLEVSEVDAKSAMEKQRSFEKQKNPYDYRKFILEVSKMG